MKFTNRLNKSFFNLLSTFAITLSVLTSSDLLAQPVVDSKDRSVVSTEQLQLMSAQGYSLEQVIGLLKGGGLGGGGGCVYQPTDADAEGGGTPGVCIYQPKDAEGGGLGGGGGW